MSGAGVGTGTGQGGLRSPARRLSAPASPVAAPPQPGPAGRCPVRPLRARQERAAGPGRAAGVAGAGLERRRARGCCWCRACGGSVLLELERRLGSGTPRGACDGGSGDARDQPGDGNRGAFHPGPAQPVSSLCASLVAFHSSSSPCPGRQGGYTCTHLCLPSALLGIFQFLVARRRLIMKL